MKNPIVALLLGLIPGAGLLYLGKLLRVILYLITMFVIGIGGIALYVGMGSPEEIVFLTVMGVGFVYFISLIDTVVSALKLNNQNEVMNHDNGSKSSSADSERFYTIILSFVPGLGHFQLGLMNRGLTLLASFFGLVVMVFFVTFLTGRSEFLIFVLFLPVLWVYGFFDVIQQFNKKQRGEKLVDRTILEDLEMRREDGRKSKAIATFLSIFPGAGHLYLGLQRRGIQLMAAFLFSIYILDVLRLGIFLFLIPIIWFYSFFDGLQKASRYNNEPLEDTPIVSYLINQQRWIGIGLVLLGLYYMTTNIFLPVFASRLYNLFKIDIQFWFEQYFQTAFVCILLIGGGLKLLFGQKTKGEEDAE